MREITLTTKHHFYASHQLKAHTGPCQRLHGHTWIVEVSAKGIDTDLVNNILIDFGDIKEEIDKLDHQHLNDVLKNDNPTAEFIAIHLLGKFEDKNADLTFKVRVWESETSSAEVVSDGY